MAVDTFLETKLRPTFVSNELLQRQRLLDRLTRLPTNRLAIVHGAAGSGKSSLLYSYVQHQKEPRPGWYSLGEEDRDPRVFFSYFLHCLSKQYPGSLVRASQLLKPDVPLEATLPLLKATVVNELLSFSEPVAIVLDDYHIVQDVKPIADWLSFLVTRGPANLTLVLATRELPELPLPYLRAKRMLLEVRQDELRFEQDEVEQLFNEVWHQPLESSLVPLLMAKTEGWITGLQLVAQAILGKSPQQSRTYIEALEGKEEFIYNYLATEVFELQPEEIRRFLVSTSIVDQFSTGLAQTLVETNAAAMLHRLDVSRLFLVHLDPQGEWFRYHHLFRDFLRKRLTIDYGPETQKELHLQAARWYSEHGDIVAALSHYVKSDELDQAAEKLELHGTVLLSRGLQESVSMWLSALPTNLREMRPGLIVLEAEIHDLRGDWGRAVAGYGRALDIYTERDQRERCASTLERLSLCYIKFGETRMLIKTCREGLATCPEGDLAMRAMLSCWLGSSLVYTGEDWEEGYRLIQEGEEMANRSGDQRAISWARMSYGFVYHFPRGNYSEAIKVLNHGIDFFQKVGWSLVVYQLSMNKVLVKATLGLADKAWELLEDTSQLAERAGHVWVAKGLEELRGRILVDRGELREARQVFEKVAETEVPAQYKPYHYRTRMLLEYRLGNVEQALVLAEEMTRVLELTGEGIYALDCLLMKSFVLLGHDLEGAVQLLNEALVLCQKAHAKFFEMLANMLLAVAHREQSRTKFKEHLVASICLTDANGYLDYWVADPLGIGLLLLVEMQTFDRCHGFLDKVAESRGERLTQQLIQLVETSNGPLRPQAVELLGKQKDETAQTYLKELVPDAKRPPSRKVVSLQLEARAKWVFVGFGSLQVSRDGTSLLAGQKVRPQVIRLLKYLLCRPHKLNPIDQLLEVFWPEAPLDKARHNLASHVSLLRKALQLSKTAGPKVERRADAYRLNLDHDSEYDVTRFERLVGEGRSAIAQGQKDKAVARFLRAELLYKDDFLADDLYEDWITGRRNTLRNTYEHVMEYLADQSFEEKNYADAISRYRRLLTEERLDERIFVKLLRCFHDLGDRSAAIREFDNFKARLAEAHGLEPTASTRSIVERLLEQTRA